MRRIALLLLFILGLVARAADQAEYVREIELGEQFLSSNDIAEAEKHYIRAVELMENGGVATDPLVIDALIGVEAIQMRQGRTAETVATIEKALKYVELLMPQDQNMMAMLEHHIVVLSKTLEDLPRTIAYGERLLHRVETYGLSLDETLSPIMLHMILGVSYQFLGNNQMALEHMVKILEDPALGSNPPIALIAMRFATTAMSAMGYKEEVKKMASNYYQLLEALRGSFDDKEYARELSTFNMMLLQQNKLDSETAIALLQNVIDLTSFHGELPLLESSARLKLAREYAELKRYDEAERLVAQADSIRATVTDENLRHLKERDLEFDLYRLLTLFGVSTNREAVYDAFTEVADKITSKLHSDFAGLTENERSLFWDAHTLWYNNLLPTVSIIERRPRMIELLYDGLLQSKGILLNSTNNLARMVRSSGDAELIAMLDRSNALRDAILAQKQRGYDATSDRLALDRLEHEMLKRAAFHGNFMDDIKINWRDVRSKLLPSDLAVEFVTCAYNSLPKTYYALLLRRDFESPRLVKVCTDSVLQSLRDTSPLTRLDGEVWNAIWKPILADAGDGVKRILFSPVESLHGIPVEYCAIPSSGYGATMFDRYDMRRLSSTREVAKTPKKPSGGRAVIVGDVDYDAEVAEVAAANAGLPSNRDVELMAMEPSDIDVTTRSSGEGFVPLPGSKVETDGIAAMMSTKGLDFRIIQGVAASEEAVKRLSATPVGLLHFATHGYYEGALELTNEQKRWVRGSDKERRTMLRSGLVFAGANTMLDDPSSRPEEMDNGLLTASEIAMLDFNDVDLVVMSACESGLGDISAEGVFGLQRGFKKAGVKSLLMSLVSINDYATTLFMTEFYRNLLDGATPHDALVAARRYMEKAEDGRWASPAYTAPFILLD